MWRLPALAGAALMPASLFLDWYEIPPRVFAQRAISLKGWDAFESTDAVMVLAAIATLFIVVTMPPPRAAGFLMAVGGVATGVLTVALIDKPSLFGLPSIPGISLQAGAWLGLLGAVLIVAAGGLSTANAISRRG